MVQIGQRMTKGVTEANEMGRWVRNRPKLGNFHQFFRINKNLGIFTGYVPVDMLTKNES